jgi:hypothetical protein
LSPNPHALTIYLEFIPTRGAAPKRFEECQCEDEMSVSIVKRGFPVMAIIVGYEGQSTSFPWSTKPSTRSHLLSHSKFFAIVIYILSHLLSCNSFEAIQADMLIFKFDFDSI